MPRELRSVFDPLPPQKAFLNSTAKIRGYGGAMGGGKSRTLCEDAFDAMLDYPGIIVLLCRAQHTSIVETTKKTMLNQVVPAELITGRKGSQGEDYIELWNGSRCHFVGLDNPLRWYSSELGLLGFDEAQEIKEDAAVRLITRLRQACRDCNANPPMDADGEPLGCSHMPWRASFTFNPSSPGHWLQQWFLLGGTQTESGFYKPELFVSDATSAIGDAEFVFAKAGDNKYLPPGYINQTLAGLPERLRRRYLEGLWEFTEGNGFFDSDALAAYERVAHETQPLRSRRGKPYGRTQGDPQEDFDHRRKGLRGKPAKPIGLVDAEGPLTVFRAPVRETFDDLGNRQPGHRYVMGIDTSSGGSYDYSAIQVVSVETFEQVAEYQAKLPPTELAIEAYRIGRIYNNATAVPEITGGWGFTIEQELKRLHYPNLYTRKVLDRLSKKWTDKTGWDTTARSRAHMLDTLERVLREQEFGLFSLRTVSELATFVYDKNNKPQAQDGCNDDLVVSLAIAVTVAADLPRQVRRPKRDTYKPQFASTGY